MHFTTDPSIHFCRSSSTATPIRLMTRSELKSDRNGLDKAAKTWIKASGFTASIGQICLVPDKNGALRLVLFGLGNGDGEGRGGPGKAMAHGKLARKLPAGKYVLEGRKGDPVLDQVAWALGGYSFDRYRKSRGKVPQLAGKLDEDARRITQSVFLTRDLVNTPANDMGPEALEKAFRMLGKAHTARIKVIKGDALLKQNFPMVHAVGRASNEAPRVLDMTWGKARDPKITLVGKGVTFDTGGLNIKPGGSMALMKKDMGGAANVMGLAHMIMDANLPVRLRVIIGAVENAISGNSFRPGDVLSSRKGLTVEIGNTDAEGRLVLGDCLALGDEEKPDLMVDMATLTGAARVALGPDLPPFYTHDDVFSATLSKAANAVNDPMWRMPLWQPYQSMMSSKIADVNHITQGGFAGSVTAALFLSRFVEHAKTWVHFDIFAHVPREKPWAPVGGEAQCIRALYEAIKQRSSR